MIWAQFSVETNNPAFSRHFLTFDLTECSRMFPYGHSSASKQTIDQHFDRVIGYNQFPLKCWLWSGAVPGKDAIHERVSCRSTSGRCLCLVEREVFFLLFITLSFSLSIGEVSSSWFEQISQPVSHEYLGYG